jgi:hypothetical protein
MVVKDLKYQVVSKVRIAIGSNAIRMISSSCYNNRRVWYTLLYALQIICTDESYFPV